MASETGHLRVVDSRTEKGYLVPIYDNHINAKDLSAITILDGEVSEKLRVLDNGFETTACMDSAITFIDGKRGQVMYRGIPIQDVFRDNDFEDVLHLLLWSRLPTKEEKLAVRAAVFAASTPPQSVINTIKAFPPTAETYPMIIAGISAFIAIDADAANTRHQHSPLFHGNLEVADAAILRTIGYYSAVVGLVHCHKRGLKFHTPEPNRSLIGNLLIMMGKFDPKTGTGPDPTIEKCLSKLWICYADHEMTNSTAALLHAASTLTDPISCVMAGLICGYGPLHGGAIDLAYEALEKIGHPRYVPVFIEMIKAKKARLFGYGHRIYKTRDPRLALIEDLIAQHQDLVSKDPLLEIALTIDKVANEDPYFVSRNLKANADLLGCFLYSALGFERDIIVPVICLSRVIGGLAHWRETLSQPIKLWRPLQVYSGPKVAPEAKSPTEGSISSNDFPIKNLADATAQTAYTPPKVSLRAKAAIWWMKRNSALVKS
ncbi:citrate synthase [Stachybotrys elegans]|uniref:Citrate synthase n=1 Tax=Stachybotrys elegans TaxID=80388 RepID=A0A8K0T1T9_9HYPO|nr:citrate synthase [Stachybotrys elegans]